MQFDWNEANIAHIARHLVTPDEAEQVAANDPLELEVQLRNGEERIIHLGETDAGRVLFVIVTVRGEKIRVVTAHPANKKAKEFMQTRKTSPMTTLETPDFKSEEDEAAWWDNNQDQTLKAFEHASQNGLSAVEP